jgi:phage recombination protein Bet
MSKPNTAVATIPGRPSLIAKVAAKYSVDPDKMLETLKATAFKGEKDKPVTNEQMMALLVVADQYNLNPWLKEIYAFPDQKGGIVPLVSVDGWTRIINEHQQLSGFGFEYDDEGQWVECIIERKDRSQPIRVREYLSECRRNTGPWGTHPQRMLRHKALIQCARLAFGFGGIYDEDEGARIREALDVTPQRTMKPQTVAPRAIEQQPAESLQPIEADHRAADAELVAAEETEAGARG